MKGPVLRNVAAGLAGCLCWAASAPGETEAERLAAGFAGVKSLVCEMRRDKPLPDAAVAEDFQRRADALIDTDLSKLDGEFEKLRHGIAKVKRFLFTFLRDRDVPPDNNASERAVRIIKVKQKVSGCFRTELGADIYARLHSVMDTAHKNKQSKYQAMLALAMT